MKIKKLLAVILAAMLVLSLLSACTEKKNESETQALPTLATPERLPGESGEEESVSGTKEPAATGEEPASAAPDESGEQDPDGSKTEPGENSGSNPGSSEQGGSSSNPGGNSGSDPTPSGDETDEDLYHVEPDTDDSDENLG